MRRSTILSAAVSGLALCGALAAPALAQSDLRPGQTVQGALAADDPTAAGWEDGAGHHYDDYAVRASAGQRLEATMTSDTVDAYLAVYAGAPGEGAEPVATNDDSDGTNALLRFTAPEAGLYTLRARSFGDAEVGDYVLTLTDRGPAPRAPRPRRLRVGQDVGGELTARDAETEDGQIYDLYSVRLAAGQRVAVGLTSEDFDPLLAMSRAGEWVEIARNDDHEGLNSRILFTAPEAGEYLIRATAFGLRQTGDYRLTLDTPPPPPPMGVLEMGATAEGELTADDGDGSDMGPFDAWRFQGRAGMRAQIDMGAEFDTYLVLGREGPAGFEALAEDDDGGDEGLNSRIIHTLDADGEYVVRARAFGEGATGPYTLALTELAPAPAAERIAFGATVQGEITHEDVTDSDGRHYDAWGLYGRQGQRMQAVLRSGDFDTFIEVGPAGDGWEALASDDDGLGQGLDSRLNFTFPEDGEYEIRAMPLGGDATGLYSLELTDRGAEPAAGSLMIGSTGRGALDENDSTAEDGSFFDAWEIEAEEGDRLRITMVSNAFDAMVALGRVTEAGEFEAIASDDDGLSDTNARLDHTVPETGTYVIRAGSFGPGGEGEYSLSVERRDAD